MKDCSRSFENWGLSFMTTSQPIVACLDENRVKCLTAESNPVTVNVYDRLSFTLLLLSLVLKEEPEPEPVPDTEFEEE